MAALLGAVAFLQFRATRQIAQATEDRIAGNLESLMIDWHLDFYRRSSATCVALQVGPDSGAFDGWEAFRDRYAQLRRSTRMPQLIRDLYIWETSQKAMPRLLSLSAETGLPAVTEPPPNFGPLLTRLRSRSASLNSGLRAWQLVDSGQPEDTPSPGYLSRESDPPTGWQFEQNIPAIVHPIVHHKLPMSQDDPIGPEAIDWIIIALDIRTIERQLFPELTLRHFGISSSADYSVAVAARGDPEQLLYRSSPDEQSATGGVLDAQMNIFGPPPISVEDSSWIALRNANAVKVENWRDFAGPIWFPVIQYSNVEHPWMLILSRRKGRLEDRIADAQRLNLATNGVVLLLLAAGVALIMTAGHRAQKYARLEMDFVASISHELRTPLTAIYSAGENLADGVVESKPQLQHYGSLITSQARQLIRLVDQVLTFASTHSGEKCYEMRVLEVAPLIGLALQNTEAMTRGAGFSVEAAIAPGLPPVRGDQGALVSCLQNLIVNAVKYSGRSRWIRVTARTAREGDRCEIQVSVEDRGIGIAASEMTDIFKPFYRSPRVKAQQLHGTGLGLSVAREITEKMGGRIAVRSSLGAGSIFTICLPCAGAESGLSSTG